MTHIYLHIGTHKTGTTSLQAFLQDCSDLLLRNGIQPYTGLIHPRNHVELFLSAVRSDLENSASIKYGSSSRDALAKKTRAAISDLIEDSGAGSLFLSCEYLSLLREEEEMVRLLSLFPSGVTISVILVLRDKQEYLASYRNQMVRSGYVLSSDKTSGFYVEPDTWLVDYESIKRVYEKHVGKVHVIPYRKDGVISDVLKIAGVHLPSADTLYRLNDAKTGDRNRSAFRSLRKRLSKTGLGSIFRKAKRSLFFLKDYISRHRGR